MAKKFDSPQGNLEQQRAERAGRVTRIERFGTFARVGDPEQAYRLTKPPVTGTFTEMQTLTEPSDVADRAVVAAAGATMFMKVASMADQGFSEEVRIDRAAWLLGESISTLQKLAKEHPLMAAVAFDRVLRVDPLDDQRQHAPEVAALFAGINSAARAAVRGSKYSNEERAAALKALESVKVQLGIEDEKQKATRQREGATRGLPDLRRFTLEGMVRHPNAVAAVRDVRLPGDQQQPEWSLPQVAVRPAQPPTGMLNMQQYGMQRGPATHELAPLPAQEGRVNGGFDGSGSYVFRGGRLVTRNGEVPVRPSARRQQAGGVDLDNLRAMYVDPGEGRAQDQQASFNVNVKVEITPREN